MHRVSLKRSTPPEVIWLFDSALCLWAIIRCSKDPIAYGTPTTTISWSETPQLETWIAHGGGAMIQGIGDVATLTTVQVLQHCADRLETLSWGLVEHYRQILVSLSRE